MAPREGILSIILGANVNVFNPKAKYFHKKIALFG
jgi:hypothetical protein